MLINQYEKHITLYYDGIMKRYYNFNQYLISDDEI